MTKLENPDHDYYLVEQIRSTVSAMSFKRQIAEDCAVTREVKIDEIFQNKYLELVVDELRRDQRVVFHVDHISPHKSFFTKK